MISTSLDNMIDEDNPVMAIDAYVNSLDLLKLEFPEYSGNNIIQSSFRWSDLLKFHIYEYLNKIR